ncbi:ABC-F family ATP-binding cassette domain-containing protein [Cytophaga hutchinsonii]|jgi:ATPase subunit of ABC transporter with duplicated ATPase domains|uniref:Probable ATP-binding protein YbiT n=1 Tax=Cytophaga hutchinsonii (strain ATCC 33406 / DSM 1761 / CIP 103989 / NBRC 15051 / NCIMB 9469 / D465) TaxID=269798 RepID=A0A6N4SVU8_CYTH3|nr:ATP-binding cassette domain-containing protein [Cytophaga hutchinsonii]ABG60692.1 ABC transporter, ATP-binding protein [Cytophaga hutchinsonii ATCC 33406]SFX69725.1 ATPase components of ABC transporters with duplicated ATPase domains [Cytophaga hutchinsonii ATCC 33406]
MLSCSNISLKYGKRTLFEEVTIRFASGNCYGLIGANGAGKSTFLKILSGEIDPTTGKVEMSPGERMAILKQNHYEFDEFPILETVMMGHKRLYQIMKEREAIYANPDFSEEDGIKASELESEFADLNGWNAEAEAAELLSGLGVKEENHYTLMQDVDGKVKVRVLLAQAIFGNPDVLLLDEPTNDLDVDSVLWLENFLADFKNTVIVISHDRHFLDTVCTHVADIDYAKIKLYTGNYTFWYESSQLAAKQKADQNRKVEDKRKELQDFVERFSANASKSKQATSRKKLLEKLVIDEIQASSRKYPGIQFRSDREAGDQLLTVEGLSKKGADGNYLFKDLTFTINKADKVSILSKEPLSISALFDVLMGVEKPDAGAFKWGITTSQSYFPRDNSEFFSDGNLNLVDWLRQYSKDKDESYIRGFLGRMLFTGEESLKKCTVLSGGEKVRCMLSKMMMESANVLIMDDPTNHLDLESITALNNALMEFKGTMLFYSHDYQFINTIATRIIELGPNGFIDKTMTYEEYLEDDKVKLQKEAVY